MKTKLVVALSVLMVAAFVLSACAPQTVEVIKTVEVEKQVEVVTTQEVEVVKTEVVEVEKEPYTTPHPILSDLRVRQALAYCTNKLELTAAVYPLVSEEEREKLVMHTMMPRAHWAYAGDENITIYPYDPEKGKALLEEAGWTMLEGYDARTNEAGDALSLKFTTTSATFRQTWAAVLEQQLAECGIQIVRLHAPASWWFGDTTGLARRDFELGAYAWVGEADPGGLSLYACVNIPTPANGWTGQNYPGWCNAAADKAINTATNTLVKQERIDNYLVLQQEYTKDIPTLPLFERTETFAYRADMTGVDPHSGEPGYLWNIPTWEVPGSDTIVLGFTQEPATLYTVVEDAWVSSLAASLAGFVGSDTDNATMYTSLDYDFQPVWMAELPTLENGKAVNNDVEVKEGDKVLDTGGNVVELAAGVMVKNAAGEEVEFTGDPITMKQMVITYEFRDDLKWPDGEPVKQADYELFYNVRCDPESGATTFTTCERTGGMEFMDNGYVWTGVPGSQDPLYFLPAFGIFPAHRVTSDGRTLAEIPAKEFLTLAEIAEYPWGVGPYVLTEWVKGEKMVFEAHPYWFGGAPKTPNVVISFVTPENAEAQLLAGQVDILGSESLAGITETLAAAEAEGKILTISIPGGTWEHIDLALFVK